MKATMPMVVLLASALHGQLYEAKNLGVPPGYSSPIPGFFSSRAVGINNNGAIAVNGVIKAKDIRTGQTILITRAFRYDINSTWYEFGTLGGPNAYATAINDSGVVVGYSDIYNHGPHRAFMNWQQTLLDYGGPPSTQEFALAVNVWGTAVGYEDAPPGITPPEIGVMYRPFQAWQLPMSNGTHVVRATGITDWDAVVAYQHMNNGDIWGLFFFATEFPWSGIQPYRILPVKADARVPGLERGIRPYAVNENGITTGAAGITTTHAFRSDYFTQPAIDLGTLNPANPSAKSVGTAINDNGLVVGYSDTTVPGQTAAFLHNGTQMIDLNTRLVNPTGWRLEEATGINNKGEIVGSGIFNGEKRAFLLVPKP